MFANPTTITPYVVGLSVLYTLTSHASIVVGVLLILKRSSIHDSALSPTIQLALASLGVLMAVLFAWHLFVMAEGGIYPDRTFPIHELSGTRMIFFHFALLASTQVLWHPKARSELVLAAVGLLQLPNCYIQT